MDRPKEAYDNMAARRMNCAQTVLSTFCEDFGLARDLALSLAQGFGGGMGHNGLTCGAVTGAYMALGLAQKNTAANPREKIDKTYDLVNEFNRQFEARHKFLNCRELTGYDLSTSEGLAAAREKKVFNTMCPDFVRDSVKIVEDLLKLD